MPSPLHRLLASALALALPASLRADPPARSEANVSIRNEVQLAIDKALARLQGTQRADGGWGKVGVTGFALLAVQGDPRGRGRPSAELEPTLAKGYACLRQAFADKGGVEKIDDFAWNGPPALLALNHSLDQRDLTLVARGHEAVGAAALPEAPETRALFLAVDPKTRAPGDMPSPATGSAFAAWLWMTLQHDFSAPPRSPRPSSTSGEAVTNWLREHYTLERNPGGDGVHRYYFWLSWVLGKPQKGFINAELKLSTGQTVDIPRQLAERLINAQNGNGSWSGIGEHWTEKDPDLVTALCLLVLERVYRQL